VRDGDFAGHISGAGDLSKISTGSLILRSSSDYTGGTTIQEGTLTAGHAQALGTGVAQILPGSGAEHRRRQTLTVPGGVVFDTQFAPGAGPGARGALTGSGTAQYGATGGSGVVPGTGGAITLNVDAEVGGTGGTLTLTGAITGPHTLFKVGAGTVVLSSANAYTQGTVIQEGTLTAGHAWAFGDGPVRIYRGGDAEHRRRADADRARGV
jgi:fibronectin-binding autotransporter adhesin